MLAFLSLALCSARPCLNSAIIRGRAGFRKLRSLLPTVREIAMPTPAKCTRVWVVGAMPTACSCWEHL